MNNPKILISGDYNAFKQEGWNGAGVYMVSGNYKSETVARPIYIGSSIDLYSRIQSGHISSLNKGNHYNIPLQKAWDNHGGSINFIWFCLEICAPEDRFDKEQEYFDNLRPFISELGGFNIKEKAYHVPQMESKQTRSFSVVDPDGNIIHGKNIRKFALNNGLTIECFRQVISNKRAQHRGWRFPDENSIGIKYTGKPARVRIKDKHIVSPDGILFEIDSYVDFGKLHGLNHRSLAAVVSGRQLQYMGWRRAIPENIGVAFDAKYLFKQRLLISPEGEYVSFKDLAEFAKTHNLSLYSVGLLVWGHKQELNGWTLPDQTQIESFRQKNLDSPDKF